MTKHRTHPDGSVTPVHLSGWKRQSKDARDAQFSLKIPHGFQAVPASIDNRPVCSPIEDQGNLGSCTANMFAGLVESNEIKAMAARHKMARVQDATDSAPQVTVQSIVTNADGSITFATTVVPSSQPAPTPDPTPTPTPAPTPAPTPDPTPTPTPAPTPAPTLTRVSRLFEYYGTRKIEGTTSEDAGASIRDAIKCGATYGIANENVWPYDITQFAVNPPLPVWANAVIHKVTSYHSIADGDIATMKATLAQGFLIGFGFNVYSYFMSADMATNAFLNVPGPTEQLEGGHAVCLVGYDDSQNAFLVRNSWGTDWGMSGYFWMSYDYVADTSLCSDFWVVQSADTTF